MRFQSLVAYSCAAALLTACGCGNKHNGRGPSDAQIQQKDLIEREKQYVKLESDNIDQYVKRQGWDKEMKVSGTGLRYMFYKRGSGEQAANEKFAKVSFKISLLDGTECYSSEKDGPKEFRIGRDNVESGLHEAVAMMRVGDKAIFILPSHLAHGLMGDFNKIPPKASVVYDIELLGLR
jgi:FKBP-type peptidyl-prolyl cis-trans isomerase FkpA